MIPDGLTPGPGDRQEWVTMQVEHDAGSDRPETKQREGRQVVLAAVATLVVAVGLWILLEDARWDPAGPVIDSPLVLADRWVEEMNRGDLDGALAVLSPQADCDLPVPTGGVETCQAQLGFMVAIGAQFRESSCRVAAPFRCAYRLTSDLHTVLGYPNPTLRMGIGYELDDGRLRADLFREWDTSDPYYPGALQEFWDYLGPRYPELSVDPRFGPALYDASAAITMLAAAEQFTDPRRIAAEAQTLLDTRDSGGMVQCELDIPRACSEVLSFLTTIDADVELSCAIEAADDGDIPCEATIDSAVHETLGSEPTTNPMTISSVGGVVRGFELELAFSNDPITNEAFIQHMRESVGSSTDRRLWTGDTGADWLAAAKDFRDG